MPLLVPGLVPAALAEVFVGRDVGGANIDAVNDLLSGPIVPVTVAGCVAVIVVTALVVIRVTPTLPVR